jgi:hypothetical protein
MISTIHNSRMVDVQRRHGQVNKPICTVWHRETGKFKVTLTKVRKMNLQVLLLKTKSKLHAIKCPNKKIQFLKTMSIR